MNRLVGLLGILIASLAHADEPFVPTRCQVVPLPHQQTSFRINGTEKTRWHFSAASPRPFFFPLNGPSGMSLTRMGHPGAPNHDHHCSVWFAHHDAGGHSFWANGQATQIRQRTWLVYHDSQDEAVMGCLLDWVGPDGKPILEQELVAALLPLEKNEHGLEVQITLRPAKSQPSVELAKTNFGLMAVRVAKSISAHFGGGQMASSEGQTGEKEIFGKSARWVDYSGPVTLGQGTMRQVVFEGITFFDHPGNPRYPTHWHVRDDGWMGASFCFQESFTITTEKSLVLRYLLHAHAGRYDAAKAARQHQAFASRGGFEVTRSSRPHHHYEVKRN